MPNSLYNGQNFTAEVTSMMTLITPVTINQVPVTIFVTIIITPSTPIRSRMMRSVLFTFGFIIEYFLQRSDMQFNQNMMYFNMKYDIYHVLRLEA